MKNLLTVLLVLSVAVVSCSQNESTDAEQPQVLADQILLSGRIFTVNDARPWAEAIAIRVG